MVMKIQAMALKDRMGSCHKVNESVGREGTHATAIKHFYVVVIDFTICAKVNRNWQGETVKLTLRFVFIRKKV